MRKLTVFNHLSLDGYFCDAKGDMSWAHEGTDDAEFQGFIADNAKGGGEFVFGRITYEMMASYWPTSHAIESNPRVAKTMNDSPKYIFSRTLSKADWQNTKLMNGELTEEIAKLKNSPGKDLVIFGSGQIVASLAKAGLIDTYQIIMHPIALTAGRSMFAGPGERLALKLVKSRTFGNGCIFLNYEPSA
jgi:dihydrofolate reductase